MQIHSVEDLQFTADRTARIGEIAVVGVGCESTETIGVNGGVADRVNDFHVTNVVNVQALLQTHHQSSPVQLHRLDRVGVRIVADFGSLLEVADFELPRCVQRDDGQ